MPDRIEAATFLCAAAGTGGDITVQRVVPRHLQPVFIPTGRSRVHPAGRKIGGLFKGPAPVAGGARRAHPAVPRVSHRRPGAYAQHAVYRQRHQHGDRDDFPQPVLSMWANCSGWGPRVKVEDRVAVVEGVPKLSGAPVVAPDLCAAGAALLIAGLCAEGETVVGGGRAYRPRVRKSRRELPAVGSGGVPPARRVWKTNDNGGRKAERRDSHGP